MKVSFIMMKMFGRISSDRLSMISSEVSVVSSVKVGYRCSVVFYSWLM